MTFDSVSIHPSKVHETLAKHMLVDGFSVVVDLEKSQGSYLFDSKSEKRYLDFFSFFASSPLGFNHASMNTERMAARLLETSKIKVSNSDKYTTYLAEFVETLSKTAAPDELPYYFFVEGGSLAVENSLKVAFDWKCRLNMLKGKPTSADPTLEVLHFTGAFHGRSGYSLSLTNTDPNKTDFFPKFNWPRVRPPALSFPLNRHSAEKSEQETAEALKVVEYLLGKNPNIAAIVIEPIQGEGGDNHFPTPFLQGLRKLANQYDALLIYDEIQTGLGMTGKWWGYQHHNVLPDILCFGKKMQVCGIMCSRRIDNVDNHVFKKSSRINSTWGGSLVDMVRATAILETIVNDNLLANATDRGAQLLSGLEHMQTKFDYVSNARGKGLMCAIDLPDPETRNEVIKHCFNNGVIILPCGKQSIRFRPALTITELCISEGLDRVATAIAECAPKK